MALSRNRNRRGSCLSCKQRHGQPRAEPRTVSPGRRELLVPPRKQSRPSLSKLANVIIHTPSHPCDQLALVATITWQTILKNRRRESSALACEQHTGGGATTLRHMLTSAVSPFVATGEGQQQRVLQHASSRPARPGRLDTACSMLCVAARLRQAPGRSR